MKNTVITTVLMILTSLQVIPAANASTSKHVKKVLQATIHSSEISDQHGLFQRTVQNTGTLTIDKKAKKIFLMIPRKTDCPPTAMCMIAPVMVEFTITNISTNRMGAVRYFASAVSNPRDLFAQTRRELEVLDLSKAYLPNVRLRALTVVTYREQIGDIMIPEWRESAPVSTLYASPLKAVRYSLD